MRLKLIIPLVLATGAGVSACGGGGSGSPHPARHSIGHPVRSYHVTLSGKQLKPPGAPGGTGAAVIALHHHAVVCFRFAHLHGFSDPTTAAIGQGAKGEAGKTVLELSRGRSLHHKGCAHATRSLGGALEKNAGGYYVVINNKQYPKGAVRGQL